MRAVVRWIVRIAGVFSALVVLAALSLGIYVMRTWNRTWDAPLVNVASSTDPAVIARGEYLVYGPGHCAQCHVSSWKESASEAKVPLSGGLPLYDGPLGRLYVPNLTPDPETGIGRHTNAELARMLRWAEHWPRWLGRRPIRTSKWSAGCGSEPCWFAARTTPTSGGTMRFVWPRSSPKNRRFRSRSCSRTCRSSAMVRWI